MEIMLNRISYIMYISYYRFFWGWVGFDGWGVWDEVVVVFGLVLWIILNKLFLVINFILCI